MQTAIQDLRNQLELSYQAFSAAVLAKDPVRLKNAMSGSSYMTVKNGMTSAGAKFPEAFFEDGPDMLKDLTQLTYHLAVENNGTATCVYSETERGGTTILIFKFVKEGDHWKFDLFGMKRSDAIDKATKAGDFSFLSGKEYQPSGIMPAVPSEVVPGDYTGVIDVMGYEYTVSTTINGNEQRTTSNKSTSSRITGGLKKGKNKIIITSKAVEGGKPAAIEITIRVQIGDDEKVVFSLKQENPGAVIDKEFDVK
jgi:hypothetical protein